MRVRNLAAVALLCALAASATVSASALASGPGSASASASASASQGYTTVRIPYEHPRLSVPAFFGGPSSRILYLDGCWNGGCELELYEDETGHRVEDARRGYSSILSGPVTIPEFAHGPDRFEKVAACVRRIFGPFDVEVTTESPGDIPHFRHVLGGVPDDAGFPQNYLGVSPYDFEGCRAIPNSISYGFAELVGDNVVELCELAAHELGHTLGLDHAFLCSDPMTYLEECGPKSFQDADAACGEQGSRPCQCSDRQNTHRRLMSKFGQRQEPAVMVEVLAPAPGAEVSRGYELELSVASEVPDRVRVTVNSSHTEVLEGPRLVYQPPDDLSDGVHRYEIVAIDQYGSRDMIIFSVTQGAACTASGACTGAEACVDGRCVPGPAVEGGLGDACAGDEHCLSGRCSIDPDQDFDDSPAGVCVEPCDSGGSSAGCPSGFSCRVAPAPYSDPYSNPKSDDSGADAVCLPSSGGFCAIAPGSRPDNAPLALALMALVWLVFRARLGRRVSVSKPVASAEER